MQKLWRLLKPCLILFLYTLVISSASAYPTDFSKSYNLWEKSAVLHEIVVSGSCNTLVTIVSPYEGSFDLYAKKNYNPPGSCPKNSDIISQYDKVAFSNRGRATLSLDEGQWCVIVYARSGSGSVYITVKTKCDQPETVPTLIPTYQGPCNPYKTVDRSGYLSVGQAAVYGYYIPSDGRALIDWRLSGDRYCGEEPILMSSPDNLISEQSLQNSYSYCGKNFDIYVFRDCNPKYADCNTNYHAQGPDAYVSIPNPYRGSTYYVMIYAHNEGGQYTIRMNSYTCYGEMPIIIASPSGERSDTVMDPMTKPLTITDTAQIQSVPAPTAEFVQILTQ